MPSPRHDQCKGGWGIGNGVTSREKEASATVATEAAAKVRALTDASFARIDALHTSAGKASHNTRAQEEDLSDEDLD